jgi:hypothetical protein
MANRLVGAAAGLIGGQVVARLLAVFLSSRAGERLLNRLDRRMLTPLEHRVLVQKWSGSIGKALSAAAAALAFLWTGERRAGRSAVAGLVGRRQVDWVQVLQRTAEILLAVGAIVKVVGEFLEDRQKTATESQREAARRLV